MPSRFLQIHTLTSYPATLLNRDDAGFAKRLPLGGRTRVRISSQCLKRHWRRADGPHALSAIGHGSGTVPMAVRSRRTFHDLIYEPLEAGGIEKERAEAVTEALIDLLLGRSKARDKKADNAKENLKTDQVTVLGRPEVEFFLREARAILDEAGDEKEIKEAVKSRYKGEAKKNLDVLRENLGMGLDAAMFGRMVTSDILARCDAAVHVAHAFTVHASEPEPDYFSAVDDIDQAEGHLGSGHINTMELTSGLFYGYVVIDVPLLVSNLTGVAQADWLDADRGLAGEVVRRFLPLVCTVSPGAKRGSTAPYAAAHLALVEAGDEMPRTLANAFLEPVPEEGGRVIEATYDKLAAYLADLDGAYGRPAGRRALALGPKELLADHVDAFAPLPELASWSAEQVTV